MWWLVVGLAVVGIAVGVAAATLAKRGAATPADAKRRTAAVNAGLAVLLAALFGWSAVTDTGVRRYVDCALLAVAAVAVVLNLRYLRGSQTAAR